LFTPEVELGVFDVFSRVSSKTVLLFPTDVFRKNESEKDGGTSIITLDLYGTPVQNVNNL
jgi:hypothetical protein